jgi:hypothetical protein
VEELCLADGAYVFRLTGAHKPFPSSLRWSMCGVEGDVQDELYFDILGGFVICVWFLRLGDIVVSVIGGRGCVAGDILAL